jgi:hypothetical protein
VSSHAIDGFEELLAEGVGARDLLALLVSLHSDGDDVEWLLC